MCCEVFGHGDKVAVLDCGHACLGCDQAPGRDGTGRLDLFEVGFRLHPCTIFAFPSWSIPRRVPFYQIASKYVLGVGPVFGLETQGMLWGFGRVLC